MPLDTWYNASKVNTFRPPVLPNSHRSVRFAKGAYPVMETSCDGPSVDSTNLCSNPTSKPANHVNIGKKFLDMVR